MISWIEEENKIMSGKGFAILDFCRIEDISLNRSSQKKVIQFLEAEVAANFDIAETSVPVERLTGVLVIGVYLAMFGQFKKLTY